MTATSKEEQRAVNAASFPLIYGAIAECMREIGETGISKARRNSGQGFNFRGIDDVYNALNPILSKHKVVPAPRYTERIVDVRQTKVKDGVPGVIYSVTVRGTITFYAPDGSNLAVETFGEAMDSADKATNKAMSAAYKYALFQLLCIPTEETSQDADNDSHGATAPQPKPLNEEQLKGIRAQLTELGIKEELFCNSVKIKSLDEIVDTDLPGLQKLLDKKRESKKAKADAKPEKAEA